MVEFVKFWLKTTLIPSITKPNRDRLLEAYYLKKERDRKLIKSKGLTNQRATEQEIAIAESQHDFHRFFMITGANQFVRMLCNV